MTKYINVEIIGIVKYSFDHVCGTNHCLNVILGSVMLMDDFNSGEIKGYNFKKSYYCFDNYVDLSDMTIHASWIEGDDNEIKFPSVTVEEIELMKKLRKGDTVTFRAKIPYDFLQEEHNGTLYKGYCFDDPESISNLKRFKQKGTAQKIRKLARNMSLVEPDYYCMLPEETSLFRPDIKRDFYALTVEEYNLKYSF